MLIVIIGVFMGWFLFMLLRNKFWLNFGLLLFIFIMKIVSSWKEDWGGVFLFVIEMLRIYLGVVLWFKVFSNLSSFVFVFRVNFLKFLLFLLCFILYVILLLLFRLLFMVVIVMMG